MSKNNIEELRLRRAKLYSEMGEVLSRADDEGTLSAEDAQEYDSREADFDKVTDAIARLEKHEGLAPTLTQRKVAESDEREIVPADEREAKPQGVESRAYHDAFEGYLRNTMSVEQRAALQVGTAAEGGYTVAEEWARQLIESEREEGVMLQFATRITTAESGQLHIPKVVHAEVATLTAEEAAYTEAEDTFAEALLDSYKMGTLVKISDELLHDSMFDLAGFIARRSGEEIGRLANTYFVTGTGTGQPNGITVASTTGKTFATNAAITADELIDLFHSLISKYRGRAVWMMNDSTIAAIRKLKDSGTPGQYLWQPGLQAGQPDLLLGRPLYSDYNVPAIGTLADSVVFGDLSTYWIREVGTATMKVLNELYAVNGQVGYRADRRLDGDLIDTAAVKLGTHPA
jgi:HK97 family phage major capsid protein